MSIFIADVQKTGFTLRLGKKKKKENRLLSACEDAVSLRAEGAAGKAVSKKGWWRKKEEEMEEEVCVWWCWRWW